MCIDIAYNVFEHQVLTRADTALVSGYSRRMARRRSLVALAIFTTAMAAVFFAPRLSFGLICGALLLHLRPEAARRPHHRQPNPHQAAPIDDADANQS